MTRRRLITALTGALTGLAFWRPKPAAAAIHVTTAAQRFHNIHAELWWNLGPGKMHMCRSVILNGHEITPLSEEDAEG